VKFSEVIRETFSH